MRRLHLFEIHDMPWCPPSLRDGLTDSLQFSIHLFNSYGPIMPRLRQGMERAGTWRVVDLCSGAGGPWMRILRWFEAEDFPLEVRLTDKFPNRPALERMRAASGGKIAFIAEPVDAAAVPKDLLGFRTLFTSFHHFTPEEARAILADAVRQKQGIGIFEATHRSLLALFLILLLAPVMVLLVFFVRPFRWSRLLWTFVLPALPFVLLFDGLVSCLRTYTPEELMAMTEGLSRGYKWTSGLERRRPRMPVTYLVGYPSDEKEAEAVAAAEVGLQVAVGAAR